MKTIKLINNEIDSNGIYFQSTNSRHLKIERELKSHFTVPLADVNKLSDILIVQQTKMHLGSEHRLPDDLAFRKQFNSWEQPEV